MILLIFFVVLLSHFDANTGVISQIMVRLLLFTIFSKESHVGVIHDAL
jgi:hypothetical protein